MKNRVKAATSVTEDDPEYEVTTKTDRYIIACYRQLEAKCLSPEHLK